MPTGRKVFPRELPTALPTTEVWGTIPGPLPVLDRSPGPTCCWSLFGKGRHQNFGWREHSLFWVLSNPNISPLPEACFLYITQQVSPLPDYSFKGHLKPLSFSFII